MGALIAPPHLATSSSRAPVLSLGGQTFITRLLAVAGCQCLPHTGGPGDTQIQIGPADPLQCEEGRAYPEDPDIRPLPDVGGQQPRSMPPTQLCYPCLLLLLLLVCQPQASSAQVMDFLFEKWKLYSDQCHHNLSLLPAPTELVCNRTFDKYSCWPDTPPNTTANISCPWYLPWYHKVQHRLVFKKCGPDGQWVRGPRGQPWRNASQCQMDDQEIEVQKEVAKMYSSFQVMYTVGYSLSLGALLLALAILLGLSKLHCTRNYIHLNLFASFMLKAGSVLVIDWLLKTRYSQKIGDDLSVSVWLSDGAVAGCRVAAVIMQYGVVANYCWLLVEGVYLHSLLSLATFPERSFFMLYLAIGWGAPLLFVIPWVVVKCLFENIQCWTSNDNMGFWWILRVPVFLAILINFYIFVHIIHLLVAKLRARQMHYADYKFRLAKSTLTLIPLLGVHEVVFAFVTDEQAQGTLRSAKLFFDLFLSSFQGLLVAVLYCFLNKEVQAELWQRWQHWRMGKALLDERVTGSHSAPTGLTRGPLSEKLQLVKGVSSSGASQDPSAETPLASGLL
ncbi:PREDICTED: glucagon receptor isoform X3 [Chinchilla lanigera]|uniref:glucagon receptor isoform X3 n=1 Tax=Chinchilla lanigera TaxID=34839 RepID=UPI000698B188|nr:PREDICTED: glucagon receptor isoform X3 [Chinchilla lanigera]